MNINVHAGHNPSGKRACGAIGIIDESRENRKVKDEVIKLLRREGHIVHDCTINDGISVSDVIQRIVAKCNANKVDIDVSIHFNAGAKNKRDDKTTGCEVLVYSNTSKSNPYADRICKQIAKLGYKNRGVKERPDLYFLRKTNAAALLVECCFVDDPDDCKLYNYESMANAIACGILNKDALAYKVKTTANVLNIRKGPGTSYAITGTYTRGTSVTILQKQNNWGKTSKGWICLSYTSK